MVLSAWAQTATEINSADVLRIAGKLNCDCGCKLTMACRMPPDGRCPVCERNKAKIFAMQQAGMKDQQIIDSYVNEMGKGVVVIEPGVGGIAGPYIALGLGLVAVLYTIRRLMQKKLATPAGPDIDPEVLAKIEKDTANLD
jgi:hypothetical protein